MQSEDSQDCVCVCVCMRACVYAVMVMVSVILWDGLAEGEQGGVLSW